MGEQHYEDKRNTLLSFLYHVVFDDEVRHIFMGEDPKKGRQDLMNEWNLPDEVKTAFNHASEDAGAPQDGDIDVFLQCL